MKASEAEAMLGFALHQLIAPYALIAVTAFVIIDASALAHVWFPSISTRGARWLLTETPFFPLQVVVGIASGFCMRRFSRLPFGEWLWILPLALLVTGFILLPVPTGQSSVGRLFGWSGLPPNRTAEGYPQAYEIVLTMPLYLSMAYSLGQRLGRRTHVSSGSTQQLA